MVRSVEPRGLEPLTF